MTYTRCPRPLAVQTLVFSKQEFEAHDVFAWCEEHRIALQPSQLLETGQSFRARQHDPSLFVPGSFRTIRLGKGESRVQAVVGCPTRDLRDHILADRAERKRLKAGKKGRGPSLPTPTFKGLTPAERRAEQDKLAAQASRKRPGLARTTGKRGWRSNVGAAELRAIDELARRLGVSPPRRDMTLAEFAQKQGLDVYGGSRRRRRS